KGEHQSILTSRKAQYTCADLHKLLPTPSRGPAAAPHNDNLGSRLGSCRIGHSCFRPPTSSLPPPAFPSHLRRAQQIAAQRGVADALVADNVDHGRLAAIERATQGGHDLVGLLHVLAVATKLLEDAVVANAGDHVERIGAPLENRHLLEARTPRAVVP